MKYLDLIKKTKEAIDELKAPFIANKNKLKLETEINDIHSKLADAQLAIESLKCSKEVDWKKVLDSLDDEALLKRQLEQMTALKEELF